MSNIIEKGAKALMVTAKAAKRLDEGFDKVFGENRTRPGDGFSMDSARQSSQDVTKQMRKSDKASFKSLDEDLKEDDQDRWI